jgi:hypothetical protein
MGWKFAVTVASADELDIEAITAQCQAEQALRPGEADHIAAAVDMADAAIAALTGTAFFVNAFGVDESTNVGEASQITVSIATPVTALPEDPHAEDRAAADVALGAARTALADQPGNADLQQAVADAQATVDAVPPKPTQPGDVPESTTTVAGDATTETPTGEPAAPEDPNASDRSAAQQAVDDARAEFVTSTDAFEAAEQAIANAAPGEDTTELEVARAAAEQDAADKGAAVDAAETALAAIPPAPTA